MDERKLTYREMQEALPDYAFGRLSEFEAKAFEASLPDYPDIEAELNGVREVFRKVDRMDFDARMERRSRNVSARVLEKMEARKSKSGIRNKVLVPALGLAAIIILALNYNNIWQNGGKTSIAPINSKPAGEVTLNIIDSSDVASLFSDSVKSEDLESAVDEMLYQTPILADETIIDSADVAKTLDISSSDAYAMLSQSDIEDIVYDQINNLTEQEFQNYIMELENVPLEK